MEQILMPVLCVLALSGPIAADNALSITPGVGIEGVVTLGMTAGEAKKALTQYGPVTESWHYSYSSDLNTTSVLHRIHYEHFGVLADFNADGLVCMIQVNVKPGPREGTFSGLLAGRLFVSEDEQIDEDALVGVFGRPAQVSPEQKVKRILSHSDYSYSEPQDSNVHDIRVMYYYSKGIYCLLTDGTLQRVGVFRKKAEGAGR